MTNPIKPIIPILALAVVIGALATGKLAGQGNLAGAGFFAVMALFCLVGFIVLSRGGRRDSNSH